MLPSANGSRFVLVAAVLMCTAVSGCSRGTGSGGDLAFAYQDRVADAASIIAVERGFFADETLAVTPLRFSSGPACSEALFTGACDVATMGDTTAVIAAARGVPVRLLASHGCGEHRHRVIVAASCQASAPADLVGLRVAVKKGTSTYGGFLAFLDTHRLDRTRIDIVDLRPPEMLQALAAGSVQAIVASEPTPSLAVERGGRPLATLGGLGNTYPILVAARGQIVDARPEQLTGLLRVLACAVAFINEEPEQAAAIVARATGLPVQTAREAMGQHDYHLELGETTVASLRNTARSLVAQGVIEAMPGFDGVLDRSLLERASDAPPASPTERGAHE